MKPKLVLIKKSREVSQETVDVLSFLLHEAQAGHILGLAFVALHGGQDFSTGIVGKSRLNPCLTRGMVRRLDDEVSAL